MKVKSLTLTNFRGFASLDLDLDRQLTVLVGVNGSGKSSLLRAIGATMGWIKTLLNPQTYFVHLGVDQYDLHEGAQTAEVVCRAEHDGHAFDIGLLWKAGSGWQHFERGLALVAIAEKRQPFVFLVGTERSFPSANVRIPRNADGLIHIEAEDEGVVATKPGYERFVEWFKGREDIENERRVAARDLDLQDLQLQAIRDAIQALMPDFTNLRIQRAPTPAMVATKGDAELRLDQLSDGERNLMALTGDLARRMAIAAPAGTSPRDLEGVVLIDEIEQHLHPAWQRKVLPSLLRAFPRAQFIVTTHSPQVVSSVLASSVVVLDHFSAHALSTATEGRDTNALLREVFGVPERPAESAAEIAAIRELIDSDRLDEARARLTKIAAALSEADEAVVSLRTNLDFAEAGL